MRKISILGDSISTLEGYNPRNYKVFYAGDTCKRSGVCEMKDTWWGRVIAHLHGDLLVNNSWSGSRVTKMPGASSESLFPAGCSDERTTALHRDEIMPDLIMIYLGTNDWAFGAKTGNETRILGEDEHERFDDAYVAMLKKVKNRYPQSEVWCFTLCETIIAGKPNFEFPHSYAGMHIEEYNEIIRDTAKKFGCKLIDIYNAHIPYESLDGTHPTANGMKTLASIVIKAMEKSVNDQHEYVILDPEKTALLYSDTLELYMCHSGETVKIQKQQIEVGRENGCDLRLENLYIARRQATFFYENQSWFLRDNHTTNGTYINGVKLQPMKKYQLAANDLIGFAGKSVEMVFYRTEQTIEPEGDADAKAIAILEAAIKVFSESKFNDDLSLKLIVASLLKAPLYFPVEIDIEAMLGSLDPTKLKAGDTIQPQKDVKMRILTLKTDDGSEIVPMFTSSEKAQKHQSVSTIRQYPQDYIATLLQMNKTAIINPFDEARFIMVPNFIKDVLAPLIAKASSEPAVSDPVPPPVHEIMESGGLENRIIDGKYRILKRISRASPVEVYLAMNEHINQVCAVKVCGKTGESSMAREFILNEALAMMKLNHPAIPKVYDIVEDESYSYVIRECIQGETLDIILKNYGAQPVDRVMDWSKQLCDVLGYLHGLNPPQIYRDMKPANVLLQPDGRVKLIDFETMLLYDEKKDYDTTFLGTKGYAAPEQYVGAGQTDARADIFGLGMTMHYLLTGVNPIEPPYITQPIRKINPTLPTQLEAVIQKCIEPDREKRYQTVDSLLRALNGEPDPAKKKGLFSKLFGKH